MKNFIKPFGRFQWLCLLCLCACAGVPAQTWTSYNAANSGLSTNWVRCMAIDAQDNKWFGTHYSGVSKFDGVTWTIYNTSNSGLINNIVQCIAIDAQGNKWFGTNGGVSKFNGTTWVNYTSGNGTGLYMNDITSIAIDAQGHIWVGGSYFVSKFDGTTWTNYHSGNSGLAPFYVLSISIDGQGNKWFGTWGHEGGVCKFDGTNWTRYNVTNSGLVSNLIQASAIDAQGNKWFGTLGGLCKFDGTNWTNYSNNPMTLTILVDSQNKKWFGTNGGGVYQLDGTNWTNYHSGNSGLNGHRVWCIAIDSRGNKWFGTENGVSTLSSNLCTTQITSNVPNNQLTCASPNAVLTPTITSGGVAPYTYRWENGSTIALRTVHRSGNYAVTVIDANGCISSSSIPITSDTTRVELSFLPDTMPLITCLNTFVRISIPDSILRRLNQFTYMIKRDGNVFAQGLAPEYAFNRVFNVDAVLGGVYDFEFTPLNTGCTVTDRITIIDGRNRLNINDFRISAPTTTLTCTTPSIPVTVVGANGNPLIGYTYAWTSNDLQGQISNLRNISTAGRDSVWVINTATQCRSLLPQTIEIQQNIVPPTVSITASNPNFTCGISNITLTATGATTYNWNDNTTANPKTIANIGTYTVTGTSANGCTNTANVTIGQTAGVIRLPQVNRTICSGSALTVENQTFTNAGDYTIRKAGNLGCDTTYTLRLSVEDSTFRQAISILAGTSYTMGGSTYSVSGTYTNRFASNNGCMRTVTTILTILPVGTTLDTAYQMPNVAIPCRERDFCVELTSNNIPSDTRGWQDTVFYPSNCVRFLYGLRGTAVPSGVSDFWADSITGRVHIAVAPSVGASIASLGTIAKVCFQLKNNPSCNAPYTISASKMLETFEDNARNRRVSVGSSSVTTTTNDTINVNMYYVGNQPQAFGNVAGAGNAYTEITSCNPNGAGVRTPNAQGQVVCKAGDSIEVKRYPNANPLNRMSGVGAIDAYKIVQFANHNPSAVPQDGMHWLAADVDGNGNVFANDANFALQISVGLRDPKYIWLPSTQVPAIGSTTVPIIKDCISMPSVSCAPQSVALWGIQRGDFVGQSVPNDGRLAPLRQEIYMDLTRTYRIGDTIVIPIGYESATSVNAVDLDITTNNNRLRFAQLEAKPASGFDQFLSNPTNNIVRNSGFGNNISGRCFLQLKMIVPNGVTLQESDFTATRSLLNGVDASFGFRTTMTTCVTDIPEPVIGEAQVRLFPNPTSQQLTIDYNPAVQQLSIVNTLGQSLKTLEINASGRLDVDVSELPNGVYFLKINEKEMKKFVKM